MKLLIDAGNTRVKWALVRDSDWLAEGALEHATAHTLATMLDAYPPLHGALGVNVAGDALGQTLQDIVAARGAGLQWLRSSSRLCGVTNLYDEPAQLGTDRWAALIGARALHAGPCLVISAGTATTVDLLDADGHFQGGLILPGERLMRQSLARDTARLPLADGEPRDPPRNTVDAIVTGCLYAQLGAIERMFARISGESNALCLLAGGNAERLAPLLTMPLHRVDNLVLRGLAVIADHSGGAHD
ncbi:MAG: type III pantothenate kinase [Pseudazoarcus pumilus]|nr:type III pantothenate kinase [Pseudazoarcus pumilus]